MERVDRIRGGQRVIASRDGVDGALAPLTGFRWDVQAIRGFAVLAVVLYHTGLLLPGGYVGVDVFFVLSGFVIARLLVAEFSLTGGVSFRRFYLRRARRLLPALALLLTIVALTAPLLAPGGGSQAARTAVATALFGANVFLFTQDGYFAAAAELNPLLHTWSLSVEEQFYFVLPALLYLAWRVGSRRGNPLLALRAAVVVAFVTSLIACLLLSYTDSIGPLPGQRLAFFSPMTRTWQFAAGVAIVLLPRRWFEPAQVRRAAVAIGSLLVVAATVLLSDGIVFPGFAALLPVAGTALLLYGGTTLDLERDRQGSGPRAAWPLVRLGDISYSWYLWHWPLIAFAGAHRPDLAWVPEIAAVVSLLPAWLSYRWLEQRFRNVSVVGETPAVGVPRALRFTAACVALPLLAAASALPMSSYVSTRGDVAAFADARAFHADLLAGCDDTTPLGERRLERCTWGADGDASSVVLVGDSKAGHFSEALIDAATDAGAQLRIATTSACPFIDATYESGSGDPRACRRFVSASMAALERDPPDLVVIGITDGYHTDERATLTDALTGETASDPRHRTRIFQAALERNVRRLVAAGSDVAILASVPKAQGWDSFRCSSLAIMVAVDRCAFPSFPLAEAPGLAEANAPLLGAATRAGAQLWDVNDDLCPGGVCSTLQAGSVLWRDSGHISVAASERLAEPIGALLVASLED